MNSRSPLVIAIGSLLWAVASAACDGVADFDITEDENGLGAACDDSQICAEGLQCVAFAEDDAGAFDSAGACIPAVDRGRTSCGDSDDCADEGYPIESFCNSQGRCECSREALRCPALSALDPLGCSCVRTTGEPGDICFDPDDCKGFIADCVNDVCCFHPDDCNDLNADCVNDVCTLPSN